MTQNNECEHRDVYRIVGKDDAEHVIDVYVKSLRAERWWMAAEADLMTRIWSLKREPSADSASVATLIRFLRQMRLIQKIVPLETIAQWRTSDDPWDSIVALSEQMKMLK